MCHFVVISVIIIMMMMKMMPRCQFYVLCMSRVELIQKMKHVFRALSIFVLFSIALLYAQNYYVFTVMLRILVAICQIYLIKFHIAG